MDFRIADTFTDSLARLTGDEQKAVKTTAFDLQMNPASPGMSFHKLDKAKDKNFWSVRVSSDIRLIVHKTRGEPAALLRRSPRQGLRLGRAAQAGDASRRPARRSWSRSARRCRRSSSRRTSSRPASRSSERSPLFSRPDRRRAARLRRARRVAGRRAAGQRGRCWPWRITCPPKRPRRCWNWRPAASRESRQPCAAPAAARSTIPMRSAASA